MSNYSITINGIVPTLTGLTRDQWAKVAIDALSVLFAEAPALVESFLNERFQDALEAFYLEKRESKSK